MSQTGTYTYVPGQGLVKLSEEVPRIAKGVYFNKGGVPAYDPSALRTFHSKAEKRQWMKQHNLSEGGVIKAGKRWDMVAKNASKVPAQVKAQRRAETQRRVQEAGGMDALLTSCGF